MNRLFLILLLFSTNLTFSNSEEVNNDPWENLNRKTHNFNMTLDDYVIRPIAETYDFIIPEFVQTGFSNVFDNLGAPVSAANNLIQFKPVGFITETSRFILNSTFGIFGLFDVASRLGIKERNEDFGQSLGHWGFASGPYLVIPFFGPSSARDGFSLAPDYYLRPDLVRFEDNKSDLALNGLSVVNLRAGLLSISDLSGNDQYSFYRDAYLQRREYEINDGKIDDSLFDDEFD
ncbi:MAG: VacJ family lipoprotein [Gammaproteobacteria bacterium]|jgi:phospholipid-binding lipoprotein MlaA|tara:strand:+ start:825 stop:1523 length:699 start_codon:yes stop_codon:yes gene_type:complete